ncbi:hypothetical protein CLOP_g17283, partial [Closterium sp. NIES-67]
LSGVVAPHRHGRVQPLRLLCRASLWRASSRPTRRPASPIWRSPLRRSPARRSPPRRHGARRAVRDGVPARPARTRPRVSQVQFLAVLVFSVVLGVKGITASQPGQPPEGAYNVHYSFSDYAPQFAAAAATGLVFALVWLQLIKLMPRTMVHIALWFGFVAPVAVAVVVFVYGTAPVWLGVVLCLTALLQLLYIWLVRHRIPFSATILKHAVHVVNTFPSTIWVAYLFLFLSLVWTVIWVLGVSGAMSLSNSFGVLIILVLSNYWTMEVFRNVVHTTVAGTTATYYFLRHNMPPNPTSLALHRAATKSFGSICFGSLIVALIQTIRFIVAALANNDDGGNFIACCAQCILACIEAIVEFFNKYAYIQIAMYGKTFIRASKDTWELFKARGVDVLINDDLSGGVLGLGMFIGGVLAALVGGLLSLNKAVDLLAAVSILSFIIGIFLTGMTLTVVDSAVGTFYVCYAEDPATLQQNDPVLYNKVQERDREIRDTRTRHDAQTAARQAARQAAR